MRFIEGGELRLLAVAGRYSSCHYRVNMTENHLRFATSRILRVNI